METEEEISMKTIDNDIKNGSFRQIYLLFGEERYLIKQYKDKLIKAMVPEGDTMNFNTFEGKDINVNEVVDLSETLPFFADRRLILIEDSGLLKKGGEELAEYINEIPESTFFIMVEDEIDKRSKLYKSINKNGCVVEFGQQTDELLARWVGSRIRKEKKGMSQEAYNLFISKTGTDMENIDKELEKLICYCIDKDMIELSDVQAVTTEQTQNKIFEMVDAITAHEQKKALDLYYDLLALKEPAMRIMYLITRQFQILMVVKSMSSRGFGSEEIAQKAGCPKWALRKYQGQCRNFTIDQLKQAVKDGADFETAVKTGQMNDQMAVELFIVKYSSVN